MKLFFLTIIPFLISSQLVGQSFFEAEGKQTRIGAISRTNNFAYFFDDSLTLFFVDSVLQYSNVQKSMVKTISFSAYNKNSEPSIQIEYFGINGRDSISKHFKEGKPSMIYKTNYDNLGRIIYYGMKDFNADKTYDPSFDWFYEYRDSLISIGKIEIQTIFVEDVAGDKRFHFRVLNEYDNKNRKVKEQRESDPNDPMAQTTIYTYNNKDSLISEKVDGLEILSSGEMHKNANCDLETEYSFFATDFNSITQLIKQKLIDNKTPLTTDKCENYFQTLLSSDKQTRLTIIKRRPYHCEGRKVIFPRYHQLDAVRSIGDNVLQVGIGKNYLIQHSAGSGKSNSIAWLAYRLSSLHNATDERIFDSVIVLTDRKVLDQQLQNTIYQFEHKTGIVQKIDKDSSQLASALGYGTNIIITTLQKFPFIVDKVSELPERKYAVIIDEAHSSQGGEASKKLKEVLASKSLEQAITDDSDDYTGDDFVREQIERSAAARGQQPNISFFAFTATPKYKILQVFGDKDTEGKPKPFHLYSMRQAIEEGFILDVLQNYTTYELYFKLTKAIEDDPNLNKKKAAKAIGKFVSLHSHNLAQKTEIIIEHFRDIVSKKIGGAAKAMLVCGSRLHAKRYYEEFGRYIKKKGYENEIKILVAFSGKVVDDNAPDGVSEPEMTGYGERELPKIFEQEEYKIVIVADKYQTGFDQPLLHTMYVDKKLSGVKAVQTLSRLNRMHPGKEDTFVLDFANDRQTILDSFQPYYEVTSVTEETDINHLYDLKARLDEFQVYWTQEIEAFANVYFDPKTKLNNPKQQKHLYAFTDPVVDRFKGIAEEEKQDEFKKGLRSWTNLYAFLSQIMPFIDSEFEKFYAYAKLLQTRLPKRELSESLHLDDEVALEYYRLQKIKEGSIKLQKGEEGELSGTSEAGLKRAKDEEALLSEIINVLNDRFGTEFEPADQLLLYSVEADLLNNETIQQQARVNKMDTFKYAFDDKFDDAFIGRMEQNKEFFEKVFDDAAFGGLVRELMMKKIYKKLNE